MMRIVCALATLTSQALRCALLTLLIASVLVAGVSSSLVAQGSAGNEETDTPCEEQEQEQQEEQEVAKFSQRQARYSKANLRRWRQRDRRSSGYGSGARHVTAGHTLPNGLRAPLLR